MWIDYEMFETNHIRDYRSVILRLLVECFVLLISV